MVKVTWTEQATVGAGLVPAQGAPTVGAGLVPAQGAHKGRPYVEDLEAVGAGLVPAQGAHKGRPYVEDLEAVCLFIARDSPHYAAIFANRTFEATEQLEQFSFSGRLVPEMGLEDIREIMVGNYRIIYQVSPEELEILTVHHGARPIGE